MMDELGKSIPISEGMVDAEQGGERKQPNEFCLNCGTKLLDTFCHHCGQKDIPQRQTLGELWVNFISSFWSYEGKFFRTAKFLITKPGFLALEYNAGRRESYYHPARMYVFISFVFFLLFSISTVDVNKDAVLRSTVELDPEDVAELKLEIPNANIDSLFQTRLQKDSNYVIAKPLFDSLKKLSKKPVKKSNIGFSLTQNEFKTIAQYDSAQSALPKEKRDGWIEKRFMIRNIELRDRYKDKDFDVEFGKAFLENFSKLLFFLLPVFALLLKLLYLRRGFFYSEHLVFSIYCYNFFYLAGSLTIALGFFEQYAVLNWVSNGIIIWMLAYLFVAMKRTYQQSWRKTILKYFVFGFLFLICVILGFSINVIFLLFSI
jgi:hypothetical protein